MPAKITDIPVSEIKTAINKAMAAGPQFLAKKIPAEKMAQNMVEAVDEFIKHAQKNGGLSSNNYEARELLNVLLEIRGCGSGFLADQCDSACVARTVNYVLNEYAE